MAYDCGPLDRSIEETLAALRDGLAREYRLERRPIYRCSPRKARRLRRIGGWRRAADRLIFEAGRVARETLPRIERDTAHTFPGPDGLLRVLMDPSTKRLFFGLLAGFPEEALPVPAHDLARLGAFSDDARALALIGDVTLRLKVLSGPEAEVRDLAALSDRWDLHESLIGLLCRRRPAGETLLREKETLARAVLGLIYVEGGADALRRAVPLLVPGPAG